MIRDPDRSWHRRSRAADEKCEEDAFLSHVKTLICMAHGAALPAAGMLRARLSAQHVVAVLVLGSMRRRSRN